MSCIGLSCLPRPIRRRIRIKGLTQADNRGDAGMTARGAGRDFADRTVDLLQQIVAKRCHTAARQAAELRQREEAAARQAAELRQREEAAARQAAELRVRQLEELLQRLQGKPAQ